MAHVQHLAIRTDDPEKLARYYEEVFGWTRLRAGAGGSVHLSDGHINIAVLKRKEGAEAGIEHFGVKIDSVAEVQPGLTKYNVDLGERPANRGAEMRVFDPDGNEIDLSVTGFLKSAY
jgi:catechol 2,3-dioxygenase-like lactoylglutathione lyase family enzyme